MRKRRRLQWWSRKLMARVPVLTSSNGVIGAPPILYGRASNYTPIHASIRSYEAALAASSCVGTALGPASPVPVIARLTW